MLALLAGARSRQQAEWASRPKQHAAVLMQVGMTGGDLEGGQDPERNEKVANLKRLFYKEETEATQRTTAAQDSYSGMLRDIPIARFKMPVLLPSQQAVFNIFQPALVHLFESLMASPDKPWLYLHVHMPGGVENLGNPQYALPGLGMGPEPDKDSAGPEALLQGTLMQVVSAERLPDARIALVSQGLSRAVVVRGTQALPFSRGDVQRLHDTETLEVAARTAFLQLARSGTAESRTMRALHLQTLSAALAEEQCWRPYEFSPVDLRRLSRFEVSAGFQPKALDGCVEAARKLMGTSALAPQLVKELTSDDVEMESDLLRTALERASEAAEGMAANLERAVTPEQVQAVMASEELEMTSTLTALELQAWLELDALLRGLASQQGGVIEAPQQLLSLLPPPPAAGWPDEFVMQGLADELADELARSVRSGSQQDDPERDAFVPCSLEQYPLRRRAQRLSFALWPYLSTKQAILQRALETTNTADRLRMVILRMKEMRQQVLG